MTVATSTPLLAVWQIVVTRGSQLVHVFLPRGATASPRGAGVDCWNGLAVLLWKTAEFSSGALLIVPAAPFAARHPVR